MNDAENIRAGKGPIPVDFETRVFEKIPDNKIGFSVTVDCFEGGVRFKITQPCGGQEVYQIEFTWKKLDEIAGKIYSNFLQFKPSGLAFGENDLGAFPLK